MKNIIVIANIIFPILFEKIRQIFHNSDYFVLNLLAVNFHFYPLISAVDSSVLCKKSFAKNFQLRSYSMRDVISKRRKNSFVIYTHL